MRILGVAETLELIDGSSQLPVMRHLRGEAETIGLAGPAIAGAAVAIADERAAGEIDEPECVRLMTRVGSILDQTEPGTPGRFQIGGPRRPFKLVALSREALRRFASVANATRAAPLDLLDAQVLAIALAEEATLLLLDTPYNRAQVDRAREGGLLPDVSWIDPGPDDPGA